jgi:acyl-CoA dehydrogenase
MNFDFSDDLKELREQARKFLRERCSCAVVRRVLEGPEAYDKGLWSEIAAMGWTGAAIPEAYGGVGLGHLGLCVLAEELGSALAPVPFSSSVYLATEAILAGGSEAQKRAWLPKLASGAAIGTLALAEGAGKADVRRLRTAFRNGLLSGEKLPVPDGDVADLAVVVAQGERGPLLALVDLKATGISRSPVETIDPTRSHARIAFNDTPAETLGGAGEGEALLRRVQDRAAVLFAFEQVGGAQ